MALLLIIAWGWVLLVVGALAVLAWARFKWRTRATVAGLLGVLALLWQTGTASLNFGRDYSRVTRPDGQCTAWVDHTGMWTYSVFVTREGREERLPHRSGRSIPGITRLQWITDSLLAIDQEGNAGYVFDLAEYDRVVEDGTDEDWRTRPWQRPPRPEEQKHFRNE